MEPRLTRGEYWLLETAVEAYIPVCFLASENYRKADGLEMNFNKPGHGLDLDALVSTLGSLFCAGFIEAGRNDGWRALDESQIRHALAEQPPMKNPSWTRYRLTASGAAAWEAFAAPQWDRLILDETSYWTGENEAEQQTGTARCMTSWRLKQYLDNLYLAGSQVDPTSVEIVECGPWQPTYWKELPSGHRARFNRRHVAGETLVANRELYWMAFSGLCEFRDGWYRWR